MTRRQKREHWQEQAVMAALSVAGCTVAAILLGTAGLVAGPPLAGLILWIMFLLLGLMCAFGARMIYCIVKFRQIGRGKSGRGQAVLVEADPGD